MVKMMTGAQRKIRKKFWSVVENRSCLKTAIAKKAEYESHLNASRSLMNAEQLEEAMQKIMDQYAGGISTDYRYSGMSLAKADEKIAALLPVVDTLAATDTYELMQIYELRERLIVSPGSDRTSGGQKGNQMA